MTLVAAFVAENFAVMTGDRRRTHIRDHSIQFDDVTKVYRLNDRLLVGHSGDFNLAEKIIEVSRQYVEPEQSLEVVVDIYEQLIAQAMAHASANSWLTFHFAGVRAGGKLALANVSSFNDYRAVYQNAEPGAVMYDLSIADYDPTEWLDGQIANLTRIEPYYLRRLGRKLTQHVAARDSFVSRDCDTVSITF